MFFANKEVAVEEYDTCGYFIFNGKLKLTKSRGENNA